MKTLIDKITEHTHDMIFGILSGAGLFLLTGLIAATIESVPKLQPYFLILYSIFFIIILIPTAMSYTKGWFRIFYLSSALILLLTYIYTKVFGVA